MTDNEMTNIVGFATQQIVGDRQELTEDECKRITWLVAEMLTVNTEEEEQIMNDQFKKRALAAMQSAQDERDGIPPSARPSRVGICEYCGQPMRHGRLDGYRCRNENCNDKRARGEEPEEE